MNSLRPLAKPLALALALTLTLGAAARADVGLRVTELGPGADDGLDELEAAELGGVLYFVGRDGAASRALYAWDGLGTPAVVPGSGDIGPREPIAWHGAIYFQGGETDRELWRFDPAGPTLEPALELHPTGNGSPANFVVFAGRLCFSARDEAGGIELVCWDGANPPELFDLAAGGGSSFPAELTVWQDRLAFTVDIGGDPALWTYDGANPPAAVATAPSEPFELPCCLASVGDELFFEALETGGTARVWRYDGVAPPTRLSTTFSPWGYLGAPLGRLLVDGEDASVGVVVPELFQLAAGVLRRVRPGTSVGSTTSHVAVGGSIYFLGEPVPGSGDFALFRGCAGAQLAPTDAFGAAGATVAGERVVAFRGEILAVASDALHGQELWRITPGFLFCDDFESGDASTW